MMLHRSLPLLLAAAVAMLFTGCSKKDAPSPAASGPIDVITGPVTFPELGASRTIQPGILFQEATLQRAGVPMRVWFYKPEKATGKLAMVIVPPAGSRMIDGMDLGEGDRPEHLPYVKAGFAVLAFEIDGPIPDKADDAAVIKAVRMFKDSQAGLANAKTALEFALAKVPSIDPNRIYIAGHSSAGTLALLEAEHEPRIKGCAAFAPVTDVDDRVVTNMGAFEKAIPGFRDFIHFSSPKTHVDKLKCPVFLFHANDDDNVPVGQTKAFVETLKTTNPHVTLVIMASGGHHDGMIREGIPKAIEWFKQLP